jgi:hypothetical protein
MAVKPQILFQEMPTVGFHNADLEKAVERLGTDGAWKRQRIVVILPGDAVISTKVMLTLWNLIFPPNNGVFKLATTGMEVGAAYSTAIEQILGHPEFSQWEYILTVEHDNMPPPEGVLQLVRRMEEHPEFDCIGGLYFTKGYGGCAQIWGDVKDPILNFRPQLPDPTGGLVECNGTGMGFNLWRMKMFTNKNLRRPWFKTQADRDGAASQDMYFWMDAKKYGIRCAIDCSVRVGHYSKEDDMIW